MEGAAAQRRLAHRWNGHVLTEARCAAIKKELNEVGERLAGGEMSTGVARGSTTPCGMRWAERVPLLRYSLRV